MTRFAVFFLGALVFFGSSEGCAEGYRPINTLLSASFQYQYASPATDDISGITYTRDFSNPGAVQLQLGGQVVKWVYLGLSFDHWLAGRTYHDGVENIETLSYQVVGAEAGYLGQNPRAFYSLTGFVGYPIKLALTSSTQGVFAPVGKRSLSYGVRGQVGLRLSPWFSVLFSCGYRIQDLGDLQNGGVSYLAGQTFNLSGFFISTGVGFTL